MGLPFIIVALAGLGLVVSLYAYVVESKLRTDVTYKPACDLSDRISCSKPMQSEYANLFFFSNSLTGIVFYLSIMLLAYFNFSLVLFMVTTGAVLVSIFLGYLLFFKIKSLCLLCTTLYVINALLFMLSLQNFLKG